MSDDIDMSDKVTDHNVLALPKEFSCKHVFAHQFRDNSGVFKNSRRICDELEVSNHGSNDYIIMREVCHVVSMRSAAIVAAGGCWSGKEIM
jgi:hypothetical protein